MKVDPNSEESFYGLLHERHFDWIQGASPNDFANELHRKNVHLTHLGHAWIEGTWSLGRAIRAKRAGDEAQYVRHMERAREFLTDKVIDCFLREASLTT